MLDTDSALFGLFSAPVLAAEFHSRPMHDTDSDFCTRLACRVSPSPHARHRLRLVWLVFCTRLGCRESLSPHARHRLRLIRLDFCTRLACRVWVCVCSHPSPCHASPLGPTLHDDPGTNAKPLGCERSCQFPYTPRNAYVFRWQRGQC